MPANAVHLPDELVTIVDEAMAKAGGYSSRAEFVRECVRLKSFQIIESKKPKKKGRWP